MAFEVFELFYAICELFLNWRLWLSIAIAAAFAFALYKMFPDTPARDVVCTIAVAMGFLLGLLWQYRAEKKTRIP